MPSIVWELKRQAAEDDLVERARHDIRRIEKRCRQIAFEHNQRARQRKKRRPVKMKTFRTQLREIESFREDRNDNQNLIDKVNFAVFRLERCHCRYSSRQITFEWHFLTQRGRLAIFDKSLSSRLSSQDNELK